MNKLINPKNVARTSEDVVSAKNLIFFPRLNYTPREAFHEITGVLISP